jgi:hypothetical protein
MEAAPPTHSPARRFSGSVDPSREALRMHADIKASLRIAAITVGFMALAALLSLALGSRAGESNVPRHPDELPAGQGADSAAVVIGMPGARRVAALRRRVLRPDPVAPAAFDAGGDLVEHR